MHAKREPAMRLRVPLQSRREPGLVHPVGSRGTIVERLGPDRLLVEVVVPDPSIVGDAWYEWYDVHPDEIEIVDGPDLNC